MFIDNLTMNVNPFLFTVFGLFSLIMLTPYKANALDCRLCTGEEKIEKTEKESKIPLRIEITTNLNFSRTALSGRGAGSIKVNERNGQKGIAGQLVDLGGYAVAGSVLITGEPGREVSIDMPNSVMMRSNKGGRVDIQSIRTDLSPSPRLDLSGKLRFSFGGDLIINGDVSGRFRGRIPITVNYE